MCLQRKTLRMSKNRYLWSLHQDRLKDSPNVKEREQYERVLGVCSHTSSQIRTRDA